MGIGMTKTNSCYKFITQMRFEMVRPNLCYKFFWENLIFKEYFRKTFYLNNLQMLFLYDFLQERFITQMGFEVFKTDLCYKFFL